MFSKVLASEFSVNSSSGVSSTTNAKNQLTSSLLVETLSQFTPSFRKRIELYISQRPSQSQQQQQHQPVSTSTQHPQQQQLYSPRQPYLVLQDLIQLYSITSNFAKSIKGVLASGK